MRLVPGGSSSALPARPVDEHRTEVLVGGVAHDGARVGGSRRLVDELDDGRHLRRAHLRRAAQWAARVEIGIDARMVRIHSKPIILLFLAAVEKRDMERLLS